MRTIGIDDPGLLEAVDEALEHGAIAIPTDTVYGLAARPANVELLAELKGRPEGMPVALLGTLEQVRSESLASWSPLANRVAEACWPGPLTLVLPAAAELDGLLAPQGTVGLRAPASDALASLFAVTGLLAVTSANLHGHAPATSAVEVAEAMGEAAARVSLVVDGGTCDGAVSSVVAVRDGTLEVIREGAISAAQLARLA